MHQSQILLLVKEHCLCSMCWCSSSSRVITARKCRSKLVVAVAAMMREDSTIEL